MFAIVQVPVVFSIRVPNRIRKSSIAWASDGDDYRDDITAIVIFLDSLPGALGTA